MVRTRKGRRRRPLESRLDRYDRGPAGVGPDQEDPTGPDQEGVAPSAEQPGEGEGKVDADDTV